MINTIVITIDSIDGSGNVAVSYKAIADGFVQPKDTQFLKVGDSLTIKLDHLITPDENIIEDANK